MAALGSHLSPSQAQARSSFDLKEYRWENRLLVVFAEQSTTSAYQVLITDIDRLRDDFDDRDMVLISLFEKETSIAADRSIDKDIADQLRQKFEVKPGSYRVFLIGKDGGIKRKGGSEVSLQDLFGLIDTMPMRRNEMRRNEIRSKNSNG